MSDWKQYKSSLTSPFVDIEIHRRRYRSRSVPAIESPLFWVGKPFRVRLVRIVGDLRSRMDSSDHCFDFHRETADFDNLQR